MLGTFTSALHAVSAAVLDITSGPETLSELDVASSDTFNSSVGGGVWQTHSLRGGSDLSTGTAGMLVDLCPLSSPAEADGSSCGTFGTFDVLGF